MSYILALLHTYYISAGSSLFGVRYALVVVVVVEEGVVTVQAAFQLLGLSALANTPNHPNNPNKPHIVIVVVCFC